MSISEKDLKELSKNPVAYANNISIAKLADLMRKLSDAYYNTDTPLVTDEVYDLLRDSFQERAPNNKFFSEIGAPVNDKNKVALPYWMGSLDKIKPGTGDTDKWLKKFPGPYLVSDKMDGISVLLDKSDHKIKFYTRGNGTEGTDISHLQKYVLNQKILDKIDPNTAIRGELIISKKNFKKFEKEYANARNLAGGIVNAKHITEERKPIAKVLDLIVYEIVSPPMKPSKQLEKLTEYGMKVVPHKLMKKIDDEKLSEYLLERRKSSDYDIDGIVVYDDNAHKRVTEKNPKYAFAFKSIATMDALESTVVDVLWEPSLDGYLKPRIQIDPVKLSGVTVTFATAFNAKYVKDNKLGPGAVVKIIRSGDVIPHILEVTKPAKHAKMPEVQYPKIKYEWNKSNVDIVYIPNPKDGTTFGHDMLVKKLTRFFRILEVKNLSSGLVNKLVDAGYDTLSQIIDADPADIAEIDGMGLKIAVKIKDNIKKGIANLTLEKLMVASHAFGRLFGERRIHEILKVYPDITSEDDSDKVKELILKLDGFSEITASQFAENFLEFKEFMKSMSDVIDVKALQKKPKKKKNAGTLFENEKVVFTGFRDKSMEEFIVDNGGNVSTSVSGNTTLLVYKAGDESSSKYKKAKELKIKTMTDDEFRKKYKIVKVKVV